MERELPKAIDAEKAVLGCVLLRNECLDEMAGLSEDDFYSPVNRLVYVAVKDMRHKAKAIDAVTLTKALGAKRVEEIGGPAYIGELLESVPHAAHANYYADIISQASRRRKLIEAAQSAMIAAYGTAETADIVADCETRLHAILESEAAGESVSVRDALEDVFHRLDTNAPAGLPMGWDDLDELYQLQPGDLVIVAARPSMGKTGLAANIAINVAKRKKAVLLFSLEQTRVDMASRLLSTWSRVSGLKINRMEPISDGERGQLLEEAGGLSDLPIGIDDDPSTTVGKIAAKARLWKRRHGLELLVIDYLQLIEPEDKRINREQQVSIISRSLKKLGMQLEIPVVCLAQLNRLSENRPGNVPKLSDLRESGSLEQDASCVILIHRPEYYNETDRPGEADLHVAKNRNGRTGVVKLQFEKSTISFRDLARGMSHYGKDEFR